MATFYTPQPWYWIVAGSTTQVWSSASFSYVAVSNSTYTKWLAKHSPSVIASAGALVTVMFNQVEPIVLAAGVPVTSTGTPAINATYSLMPVTLNKLALITSMIANSKGLPGGGGTFSYADITGTYHTFTSALILNLASGLQTFIYNWEQALITKAGGGSTSFPTSVTIA